MDNLDIYFPSLISNSRNSRKIFHKDISPDFEKLFHANICGSLKYKVGSHYWGSDDNGVQDKNEFIEREYPVHLCQRIHLRN